MQPCRRVRSAAFPPRVLWCQWPRRLDRDRAAAYFPARVAFGHGGSVLGRPSRPLTRAVRRRLIDAGAYALLSRLHPVRVSAESAKASTHVKRGASQLAGCTKRPGLRWAGERTVRSLLITPESLCANNPRYSVSPKCSARHHSSLAEGDNCRAAIRNRRHTLVDSSLLGL